MKTLWFTNTPSSAVEKLGLNINNGGWLKSLEEELYKVSEVDLAICFYSYKKIKPFINNGTHFFPVHRKGKKNRVNRLLKRIFPSLNNEEREVKELLNIIDIFSPDIIHVHGTEENFGLIQFHIKIPIVISIQGILNSIDEKYFVGIPYNIASKYEGIFPKLTASGIKQSYKEIKRNTEREKKILKEASYIIGRTEWDKRVTRVLAPKSIYFEGNEIIRSLFYKHTWQKKQFGETLQIVTTLSTAFYKGFETIINVSQILSDNLDLKFEWNVIGLNKNSDIVNFVKKWKNIDFHNLNIKILGIKKEDELVKILLNSDIYCQTSHIENSPNSLCEVMILGMPIIATYVGGTGSLLKDKQEGILIQDGDSYSFAGAIIELYNNFTMAYEYGQNASKRAVQRHNSKQVMEEYIKIYEELYNTI